MTDKCGHDGLRKMDFIRPAPPVIRPAPQTVLYSWGEGWRGGDVENGRGNVLIIIATIIDERHAEFSNAGQIIRNSSRECARNEHGGGYYHFRRLHVLRSFEKFVRIIPNARRMCRENACCNSRNYRSFPAEKSLDFVVKRHSLPSLFHPRFSVSFSPA